AHADSGKLICAICAAPGVVLGSTDILSGHKATCYPGFQDNFKSDVKYVDEMAVRDGNVITAKGPGAAPEFAFAIIKALAGQDAVDKVKAGSFF
ncbi:MAG: DJ-1/PfpI family protein, partial [Spirochaetia bacterium]|nr:DJ-1/PfpI family protein [Spirochaetia bacterium]